MPVRMARTASQPRSTRKASIRSQRHPLTAGSGVSAAAALLVSLDSLMLKLCQTGRGRCTPKSGRRIILNFYRMNGISQPEAWDRLNSIPFMPMTRRFAKLQVMGRRRINMRCGRLFYFFKPIELAANFT